MLKTKYVGKHNNGDMMKQAKIALPVLPKIQLANFPWSLYETIVGNRKFQHIENGHKGKIGNNFKCNVLNKTNKHMPVFLSSVSSS